MCGINGILNLGQSPADERAVARMNQALRHRGPDGSGLISDNEISLGHRRLAIIDPLARSNQPLSSRSGDYTIVFNGEIYNYKEVGSRLGLQTRTDSDTEVLVEAFCAWGPECIRFMNGMFAFAIWNHKTRELFLARDRIGIKPLYYVADPRRFAFSSEIRSLLAGGVTPRSLDHSAISEFLRYQTVHAPRTILRHVHALEPGHHMTVTASGLQRPVRYWSGFSPESMPQQVGKREAESEFGQLLRAAVRRRLIADVPVSCFLSGGIDSSLVTAIAATSSNTNLSTFSLSFEDDELNEGHIARLVSQRLGTEHHDLRLSIDCFLDKLPAALGSMDHPSGDGPNTFAISQFASESGFKVALSGLGGDELFGGYPIFRLADRFRSSRWLPRPPHRIRELLRNVAQSAPMRPRNAKLVAALCLSPGDAISLQLLTRQVFSEGLLRRLLTPDALGIDTVPAQTHSLAGEWPSSHSWSTVSAADIATYAQNVLLRDTDQTSMSQGLEVRVPFFDHDLVEYTLGLPDTVKRTKRTKGFLLDSFEGLLPREVWDRPKMGFTLPWDRWLRGELRPLVRTSLASLSELPIFRPKGIHDVSSAYYKGSPRVTWSRIWTLVALAQWIDRNSVTP